MSGIGDAWEPFGKPYDSHIIDEHASCKRELAAVKQELAEANEEVERLRQRNGELAFELYELQRLLGFPGV